MTLWQPLYLLVRSEKQYICQYCNHDLLPDQNEVLMRNIEDGRKKSIASLCWNCPNCRRRYITKNDCEALKNSNPGYYVDYIETEVKQNRQLGKAEIKGYTIQGQIANDHLRERNKSPQITYKIIEGNKQSSQQINQNPKSIEEFELHTPIIYSPLYISRYNICPKCNSVLNNKRIDIPLVYENGDLFRFYSSLIPCCDKCHHGVVNDINGASLLRIVHANLNPNCKIKTEDGVFKKTHNGSYGFFRPQSSMKKEIISETRKPMQQKKVKDIRVPLFNQKSSVLYIYCWGRIICIQDHHDVVDVTCSIRTVSKVSLQERAIEINAQYCRDCQKFTISDTSYNEYMAKYKFLPIRFREINQDGTFPQELYSHNRADKSPLYLAGYSVNKSKKLSSHARQKLLAFLIQYGVMKKHEIIRYLEMFINTNGSQSSMVQAREKWIEDHAFVLQYNLGNQEQFDISEIDRY